MNTDENNQESLEELEEGKEKKICENQVNDSNELKQSDQKEIKKKLEEEKDKFLRLFAEFENYKKRIQKERINFFKTSHQEVMLSLIPILSDFERSIPEIKKSKDPHFIRGIELIQEKFFRILKAQGLHEIEIKKGDDFNTDIHEAINHLPAPSKELKGKIIEIVESGYNLHDKVIRHAKVIVGK